jgi:hypothetical protein
MEAVVMWSVVFALQATSGFLHAPQSSDAAMRKCSDPPTDSDVLSGEPWSTSDAMRSGYQWAQSSAPLGSLSTRSLDMPPAAPTRQQQRVDKEPLVLVLRPF